MLEVWAREQHEWHEFYLLIGTAAATITGLMFVVVSVAPEVIAARGSTGVRAFVTPTTLHLIAILVISGIMIVPKRFPGVAVLLLTLGALGMLAYLALIHVHKEWRRHQLDRSDWLGYVALPIASYVAVLAAAGIAFAFPTSALALLAAATGFLLIVSIRNAWDLVLWMALQSHR